MLLERAIICSRAFGKGVRSAVTSSARFSSSKKPVAVLSPDGSTYLCWHPAQSFPYEHTKPLPRKEPEIRESDTELKVQYLLEEKHRYRPDGPNLQELMKIFHTTRHAFDHKPSKRYIKKNPPKDRVGI